MGYPIGFPSGGLVGDILREEHFMYLRSLSASDRRRYERLEDQHRQSLDKQGRCRICAMRSAWVTTDGRNFCELHASEYFRPFVQGEE